jgi:lipopolysaccharide export system permease protein
MKKLLFQKLIKDITKFFIITTFAVSLIVWVIQAVGFLDFVTEDGHSLLVYFSYSILSYPKILHRIIPFIFFISLFYQILQYETKNELIIFWTNGVNKINFVNVVIIYSIIITLFQIFLGAFISPVGQNEARSYLRNSNIDFLPTLMKEGKFIDVVENLTIFIESKDEDGNYKNIFLNDSFAGGVNSQMVYAKKGILINDSFDNNRYFELYDGKMINKDNGKITNFKFDIIKFNLSKYATKTTTFPKIQEAKNNLLIKCLYYNAKKRLSEFRGDRKINCDPATIDSIKQELLKRFFKPIYLPLIALMTGLLIFKTKENENYNKFKFYLFSIIIFTIVISEISLRYSTYNGTGLLFFIFFPIFSFLTVYFILIKKLYNKF